MPFICLKKLTLVNIFVIQCRPTTNTVNKIPQSMSCRVTIKKHKSVFNK